MQLEQPLANYNGSPEVEDGHTKIANELLDAIICHDFSKRQLIMLLYIIRKTYGWNKSEDDISRSQILENTGIFSPHITTSLQELQSLNVIIITNGNHAKRYKINKYYDQWRVTKRVIVTKTVPVTKTVIVTETVINNYQNGNFTLPKQYPQKTLPKDNTKDICFSLIKLLNEKANKNYKVVKANVEFINGRLKEGYTEIDLINVVNSKCEQWKNDSTMNKYLRPATLFNATKFSQYFGEIVPIEKTTWKEKGFL